tara:strand:+ start:38 stop:2470 length:2433 start_codon:yes stop_codon:yes gene_type:complete
LVKKQILLVSGVLLALSLIIPPNIGKILIFEYSDVPIVLFFILALVSASKINRSHEKTDNFWLFLLLFLFALFIILGFNTTTLRFIFYISIGFLIKKNSKYIENKDLEIFFLPLWFVSILNFSSFVLGYSLLNNSIGWITNYSDTSNIFLSGRLSGFQGSGPNVAGTIFGFFVIISFYFYRNLKKKYFLILIYLNLFLFFITYSRGSYASLLAISLIFILLKIKVLKYRVIYITGIFSTFVVLLYFGPSDYILKENDRSLLANIAISNIELSNGVGGGQYVEKIYEPYLLSVNPQLLEENLDITLNKVELGITPEQFRDTDIDFFIGTSGGGFEILQQYFIVGQCSDDRNTCQYLRVDEEILLSFLKIFNIKNDDIIASTIEKCVDTSKNLINRGEFACIAFETKLLGDKIFNYDFTDTEDLLSNEHFSYLKSNSIFVECESSKTYSCKDRPLAVGELSVMVETLFIRDNILPEQNLAELCSECEFRTINGFIKIEFDRYDYFLPRSKISFYTSKDGENWNLVGYPHFTGNIINLNQNKGFIEIGGYADGQSFGNTFLDANIKSVEINTNELSNKVDFNEINLGKEYFVYKPNSLEDYTSKITYEENGIKLFRPNKYWVAVNNEYDFNQDFEIILNLSFPEIPWETQTLVSNTSAFSQEVQSWKIDIDDGRLFFYWTNEDGEYVNQLGDKSLRSGVLIQKNGNIDNEQPPLASTSYLSQLTTAHNGYLTFFVEYGLLNGLFFYFLLFYLVFRNFNSKKQNETYILSFALLYFLIHNLTNDLVYSPDAFILFLIILGIKDSIINREDPEIL